MKDIVFHFSAACSRAENEFSLEQINILTEYTLEIT